MTPPRRRADRSGPSDRPDRRPGRPLGISVIVPTRNAADWIVSCLEAIRTSRPAQVILVDGRSDDGTLLLAEPLVDFVIRDDGRGPGAARNLGVQVARHPWVAFVDADVLVPDGGIRDLLLEARERKVAGLQAILESEGSDYWSRELAWHHNHGRSRGWFGVSATVLKRSVALAHPFDVGLASGEDVDLRVRLAAAGVSVGISDRVTVRHRFAPGLANARAQWTADGAGLGRLVRKVGRQGLRQLAIPFVAGAYWIARSLGAPRHLPYFVGFVAGNWRGAVRGLLDPRIPLGTPDARTAVVIGEAALWTGAGLIALIGLGLILLVAALVPPVPRFLLDAPWLPVVAGIAAALLVWLELTSTLPVESPWRVRAVRYRSRILAFVVIAVIATGLRLLANLRLLG